MPARRPLSVVIPVRDDRRVLRAVRSVLAQHTDLADVEVIVVDNGSHTEFAHVLRRLPSGVRLLSAPKEGPSAARNAGIDAAKGDIVFFLDSDAVAASDWLESGLAGLEATGADIVVGRSSAGIGSQPTAAAELVQRSMKGRPRRPGAPPVVFTGNVAMRKSVFERVRFDETLRRTEDWAFTLEARAAGIAIATWPAMTARGDGDKRFAHRIGKEITSGWCVGDIRARGVGGQRVHPGESGLRMARGWARLPGYAVWFRLWLAWLITLGWCFDAAVRVAGHSRLRRWAIRLRRTANRTGKAMRYLGLPQPRPAHLRRFDFSWREPGPPPLV